MDPRRLLPGLLTITVVCLVATLGVVAWRPGDGGGGSAQALSTTTSSSSPTVGPASSSPTPVDVLRDWDSRRAMAWSEGDTKALARLYVAGSRAGLADVAALRRWRSRGLRVVGMQTQVLEVTVLSRSDRRLRMVVTDRLVGGEAVDRSGARVPLPSDRASTRTITLERTAGRWRVDEVRGR